MYQNQCRRMWSNFKYIGHWQRSKWVFMRRFYARAFDNFILFFLTNHYQCQWLYACCAHCICPVNALQRRNKNNKCANTKKRKLNAVNIERYGREAKVFWRKVPYQSDYHPFCRSNSIFSIVNKTITKKKPHAHKHRRYGVTSFAERKNKVARNVVVVNSNLHVWRSQN